MRPSFAENAFRYFLGTSGISDLLRIYFEEVKYVSYSIMLGFAEHLESACAKYISECAKKIVRCAKLK
jgi:hypothetical protein